MIEKDVEIAWRIANRSQQQRNLGPMMNAVIGCVLHQFSYRHSGFLGSISRVFNVVHKIFILELGQKLAHIHLDFVPGLYERFDG